MKEKSKHMRGFYGISIPRLFVFCPNAILVMDAFGM